MTTRRPHAHRQPTPSSFLTYGPIPHREPRTRLDLYVEPEPPTWRDLRDAEVWATAVLLIAFMVAAFVLLVAVVPGPVR